MEISILTMLVIGLPAIIIAITLHEMMHAWVGYLLGDDTAKSRGRITLNPLAHINIFTTIALPLMLLLLGFPPVGAAKPVPFNPHRLRWGEYGMALVALAGPLTNLALAIAGSLVYHLAGGHDFLAQASLIFASVNIGFFVFNMIPFPPLDGSRVLYVIAPDGVRDFMNTLEQFGVFLILFIFIFAGQYISPLLEWVNDFILNLF